MKTTTKSTKIQLIVDMTRFYDSIESATINVSSPKGRKIYIHKKHYCIFKPEEKKVWGQLVNGITDFSKEEMKVMLNMTKIPFFAKER